MAKEVKKISDKTTQWIQGKPVLEISEHSVICFEEEKKDILIFTESDEQIKKDLKSQNIELVETTNGIEISTFYNVGVREFSKFFLKVIPKQIGDIESLGRMIAFCYIDNVKIFDLENIRFQKGDGPLEWLIMAFVQLSQRLVSRGLYRKYVIVTDDVPYLKGKLLLKQQIQNTMKFNMKFHCEYDEFTSNNLENQIILHTLKKCLSISRKGDLKTKIQKLIHQIDRQVEDKIIRASDFKQIHYTGLNSGYKTPLVLSKLILEQTGFKNIKQMETDLIVPFFVNMPKLFEKFLETMFRRYYSEFNVKIQDNRNPWIKEGGKEDEDNIGIEPDLVLYKDSLQDVHGELIRENVEMIIDAKYMEDLGREERFQIAFYLHEYDVKRGFAICPTQKNTLHRDDRNRIVYKDDDKPYLLKAEYQNKEIAVRHINVNEFLDELIFSNVSENEISRIMKDLVSNSQ